MQSRRARGKVPERVSRATYEQPGMRLAAGHPGAALSPPAPLIPPACISPPCNPTTILPACIHFITASGYVLASFL